MEGGATLGILLGIVLVGFTGYVAFQVVQKRKQLRDTVHVLSHRDAAFVDDLEAMKESGALCPV